MKGLEISGENLEELLAYDDLFLDYFNAFLSLPVFPQALAYNRLTGGFDEVFGIGTAVSGSGEVTPPYGITDEERERMLEWAKEERLPLFLRTQLFREFKLVKLLLRPLEERHSSSHTVRGYSRQTESYISSLSNTAENSGNEAAHFGSHLTFTDYPQSPPSRTISLPNHNLTNLDGNNVHNSAILKQSVPSLDLTLVGKSGGRSSDSRWSGDGKPEQTTVTFYQADDDESMRRSKTPGLNHSQSFYRRLNRSMSAPTNYQEYVKLPSFSEFDAFFGLDEPEPTGQNYIVFHDIEGGSEEQTEADRKNLEGRLNMPFQEMKESVLGTYEGMEDLKEFLSSTIGIHLLNFWLDCEYFKDTMEDSDELSNTETRNRLFRDIQDKYKMSLTKEAKGQLLKASSSVGLSHTIFIHTQYDVLRRLRAYWVLRFLLHLERKMAQESSALEKTWGFPTLPAMVRQPSSMSIFPSISLVKSLPAFTDEVEALAKFNSWDVVSKGGGHIPDRLKSAKTKLRRKFLPQSARPLRDGLILALTADKSAGGPFQRFITKQGDKLLLSMLLFWQDVTEYGAAENRSSDRLLRLCHAWTIFSKYIAENSEHQINLSTLERDSLFQKLSNGRDFVEASVFDSVKRNVVDHLQKSWLRFLKVDLKTFLDCRFGCEEGCVPPSTASVVEITETVDNQILITRPRPWVRRRPGSRYPGSTDSERGRRLRSALSFADSIDQEKLAEKKRLAREKRKEMEKERRKAIRAAKMRQKAAKSKKTVSEDGDNRAASNQNGEMEDGQQGEGKTLHFVDMSGNKQMVNIFKRYLQGRENKELLHAVGLYIDIQNYTAIGAGKDNRQKKENQATHIQKTYIDKTGKKHIPLPEEITSKFGGDKDRPKTPVLKEVQAHILPTVDDSFQYFVEVQSESIGIDPAALASMSRSEIAMRFEADSSVLSSWNKKKGKAGKDGNQTSPTENSDSPNSQKEEDKDQLDSLLQSEKSSESKQCVRFSTEKSGEKSEKQGKTKSRRVDRKKGSVKRLDMSTEKLMSPSAFASRKKKKQTGRSPPTKDDKVGFLMALNQSVFGRISIQLLYFFKYLIKHGEEDESPLIDRDLLFYLEVQKFKECSHIFADEEMLRRKVQCIVDCFLESITPPNVQISVSAEILQKTLKAAQKYLTGKEVNTSLFDEAQYSVFKDLLPYWAGFRRSQTPNDLSRVPTTKLQKMLRKRLEAIESYQMPDTGFSLPEIPGSNVATYSFTLHEGIKCREGGLEDIGGGMTPGGEKGETTSRQRLQSGATNLEGYRKKSRGGYLTTPSTAASSSGFLRRSSLAVR